jgi:hypothetical protein
MLGYLGKQNSQKEFILRNGLDWPLDWPGNETSHNSGGSRFYI